jgi:hypothetical protein
MPNKNIEIAKAELELKHKKQLERFDRKNSYSTTKYKKDDIRE